MYLTNDFSKKIEFLLSRISNWNQLYFSAILLLIALVAIAQDFIEAYLMDYNFYWSEVLAYKSYWLIFFLFSLVWFRIRNKLKAFSGTFKSIPTWALGFLGVLILTFIHISLFISILLCISNIIHQDPFRFDWLVREVSSGYLFSTIFIYGLFALYFYGINKLLIRQPLSETSESIIARIGKKSIIIKIEDIKYVQSTKPYVAIYTDDKKYLVNDTLKDILEKLPHNFLRVHRSTIVNSKKVKEVNSRLNGDYDVVLYDDKVLRLSRNYRASIKDKLFQSSTGT